MTARWQVLVAAALLALALAAPPARAVAPSSRLAQTPAAFLLAHEDVVVRAGRDSVPLEGWWLPGKKGAAVVVMAGGGTGNRADLLPVARALHDRGFTLLLFDYRDFGPQGGGPRDTLRDVILASRWVDDAVGALRFARARADSGAGVFAWGTDLGSVVMLGAAARDRGLVDGLVIDNPFRSVEEQMRWNGTSVIADAVTRQRQVLAPVDEPFAASVRLRAPVLLTLAGKEESVPPAASDALFRSAKVRVERWLAPAATRDGLVDAPGYLDRVTDWIHRMGKYAPSR